MSPSQHTIKAIRTALITSAAKLAAAAAAIGEPGPLLQTELERAGRDRHE